jgi:hypothetical protein
MRIKATKTGIRTIDDERYQRGGQMGHARLPLPPKVVPRFCRGLGCGGSCAAVQRRPNTPLGVPGHKWGRL